MSAAIANLPLPAFGVGCAAAGWELGDPLEDGWSLP